MANGDIVRYSVFKEHINELLDKKSSIDKIMKELKELPGFKNNFSRSSLYNYAKERTMKEGHNQMSLSEEDTQKYVLYNDAQVIDLIIEKGFMDLQQDSKKGKATVTVPELLKAIEFKQRILGAEYRSQTAWGIEQNNKTLFQAFKYFCEEAEPTTTTQVFKRLVTAGMMEQSELDEYLKN
jgi:hypothetical protein